MPKKKIEKIQVKKEEKKTKTPAKKAVPTESRGSSTESVGKVRGTKKEQVIKAAKERAAAKAKAFKVAAKKSSKKEDTGSADFQIQNFTEKIKVLSKHLRVHPHDFDSRRGLLIMVGKRRRLLNYIKKSDLAAYEKYISKLKLKADKLKLKPEPKVVELLDIGGAKK